MDVKLYIEEGPGSDQLRDMMHDWVTSTAERVGVDTAHIETVAVALEETYGEAMNDLFPGSQYTNNAYLGVGKTETRIVDGTPAHRILFNAYVIEICIQGLNISQNIAEWPADLQYGPFIIAHELGHCRHHEISPKDIEKIQDLRSRVDDFDVMNEHQFGVLVSEIGACYFGDRYYSEAFFQHACENDLVPLIQTWDAMQTAKRQKNIGDVAYYANGLSWVYVIQFSKIITSTFDTILSEVPIPPPKEMAAFSEVHNLISHSVSEFCKSDLKDLNQFRENIELARELLLKNQIAVDLSKKDGQWFCYW